jgi:hypothetical protein
MASSRFRFVTLRAHQIVQATTAPQTRKITRPVETLTARPVATLVDRFEPGASRRILGRRLSSPSPTADVRTGLTASTTATPASSGVPVTTPSDDPKAPQAIRPTPRNSAAASRVKAFENDPRWLAQCAAARERREQLTARHAQDAKTRWQSAVRGPNQSTARNEANHTTTYLRTSASATTSAISSATMSLSTSPSAVSSASAGASANLSPRSLNSSSGAHSSATPAPVDGPSAQSSTTVAVPSMRVYSINSKWLVQHAEGHERRQHLAARQKQENRRRWLRPNAHCAGDDYVPPSSSSALALTPSSSVVTTDSSSSSPSASSSALDITRSSDSRWAARTAENYARAEKIRAARRIKPIRQ